MIDIIFLYFYILLWSYEKLSGPVYESGTTGLLDQRSTNWAIPDWLIQKRISRSFQTQLKDTLSPDLNHDWDNYSELSRIKSTTSKWNTRANSAEYGIFQSTLYAISDQLIGI